MESVGIGFESFVATRMNDSANGLTGSGRFVTLAPDSSIIAFVALLARVKPGKLYGEPRYDEFAEERLNDEAVDFVDGKIICTNPENIRVIFGGEDDDAPDGERMA